MFASQRDLPLPQSLKEIPTPERFRDSGPRADYLPVRFEVSFCWRRRKRTARMGTGGMQRRAIVRAPARDAV
jgi:hypothetical protein